MKRCNKCGNEKPKDQFNKHKNRSDGLQPYCKTCSHSSRAQWARDNPDKIKVNRLWSQYKLREQDYLNLLIEQDYKCPICSVELTEQNRHIDHDHSCCPGIFCCGKCVRAILCGSCNINLGGYEALAKLPGFVKYIEQHKI